MKTQTFILKNHDQKQEKSRIKVEASIEIKEKEIIVTYEIRGELKNYIFNKAENKKRANELWRATCFELFIAPENSSNYWEFNISPTKAWNFYAFDSYKKSMREELLPSSPHIEIREEEMLYRCACSLSFRLKEKYYQFNLAVILLDNKDIRHFYTIYRKKGVADFHNRAYFYHKS